MKKQSLREEIADIVFCSWLSNNDSKKTANKICKLVAGRVRELDKAVGGEDSDLEYTEGFARGFHKLTKQLLTELEAKK